MIELKFDSQGMFDDIVQEVLIPSANEAMQRVYNDIESGLTNNSTGYKRKSDSSDVQIYEAKINSVRSQIVTSVSSYGWALVESYGTGTNVDMSNEELKDYINSNLWNPLRSGWPIVGRPKGEYKNFFGENAESSGSKAGQFTGNPGRKPNYAIQNAERRLEAGLRDGGFVDRILKANMEKFLDEADLDKYVIEVVV